MNALAVILHRRTPLIAVKERSHLEDRLLALRASNHGSWVFVDLDEDSFRDSQELFNALRSRKLYIAERRQLQGKPNGVQGKPLE